MDDDLAAVLAGRARDSGKRFKAVVNEMMRSGLTTGEEPASARGPFRVVSPRRGLLPGVDPLKLSQLADELESERFLERLPGRTSSGLRGRRVRKPRSVVPVSGKDTS